MLAEAALPHTALPQSSIPQLVPGTRWLERRGDHKGSVATIVKTTAQKVYITLVAHLQNSHSRRKAKGRTHAIDLHRFYASYEPYDARSQRLAYEQPEAQRETQRETQRIEPQLRKETLALPMTTTIDMPAEATPAEVTPDSPSVAESPPETTPMETAAETAAEPVAESMTLRHCIHCGLDKPETEFYASSAGIIRHTCKSCENLHRRQTYARKQQSEPVQSEAAQPSQARSNLARSNTYFSTKDFSDAEVEEIIGFWRARMPVGEIARAFKTIAPKIYRVLREKLGPEYTARRIEDYIVNHGGEPIANYVFMQQLSLTGSDIDAALESPTGRELLHGFLVTNTEKPWIKTKRIALTQSALAQHSLPQRASTQPNPNGEVHTDSEQRSSEQRKEIAGDAPKDAPKDAPVISRSAAIEDRIMAQGIKRPGLVNRPTPQRGGTLVNPDGSTSKRPDLTADVRAEIVRRYAAGESTRTLSETYNISPGLLYREIEKAGIAKDRITPSAISAPATVRTKAPTPKLSAAEQELWDSMEDPESTSTHIDTERVEPERVERVAAAVMAATQENALTVRWFIRARVQSEVTFAIDAPSMAEAMAMAETFDVFGKGAHAVGTPKVTLVGISLEDQ